MFIGPCIIVVVEEWKTSLMSLAILFHFLCAQHVSDTNSGQYQLKYAYQLQQNDKAHHTKHTPLYTVNLH